MSILETNNEQDVPVELGDVHCTQQHLFLHICYKQSVWNYEGSDLINVQYSMLAPKLLLCDMIVIASDVIKRNT